MTPAQNPRVIVTKAVLWFLVGVAAVVTVVRFARGLGVTTALTDVLKISPKMRLCNPTQAALYALDKGLASLD